ncbi:dihydrofolate reductase family protein [Dyadobacter sp. CY345]|uniref:dihydrofolate reductase family protein n=1 Tax=Dyadobacter sp. CY345 TaxID=2909335 RepID=UPI001F2E179D|nr:dihydrofolate reductase family protein [Dyadobacter sp. CY345]MCF2447219.1 dihydrofolate reductase family protein [Dyadobacter sp. CY345]
MRKVIVSMNVTLDGFMAGPNCELDWHFKYWNEEMAKEAAEQLNKADTILLGRITYLALADYWPFQPLNPNFARQDMAYADMMNNHRKIVFSSTLKDTRWNNSVVKKDSLKNAVCHLKQQSGKEILVLGSGTLVASLIEYNLIDEYQLWVHPVTLGKGKLLFKNSEIKNSLKLVKEKEFESGVVIHFYIPACINDEFK